MVNRAAVCLSASLILGTLFGNYGGILPPAGLLLFLLFTGIAIARGQEGAGKAILSRCLFCILAFGLGAWHFQAEIGVRDRLEAALAEGETVTVQGKVQQKEERPEQCLYTLADTYVLADGSAYPSYRVLAYSSQMHIQPGDVVEFTGTYAPFQNSRNEGNFNEKQYYQSKKTEFRLYAEGAVQVIREGSAYVQALGRLRQKFKEVYQACMGEGHAGLLADMALGDKSLLDGERKDLYQKAGVSHILAISGLHVSLFGMGVYRLLQKILFPDKLCALCSVGAVVSFGLLSGMEISTTRAIGMFCLGMAARAMGYSYDSATALGISAILQVWGNPFVLGNAGFLFSYGAVFGVTVAAGILKRVLSGRKADGEVSPKQPRRVPEKGIGKLARHQALAGEGGSAQKFAGHLKMAGICKGKNPLVQRCVGKLLETMFSSACIQLTTLPLSLYFYYEVPCYSILANGLILPFLGPVLSLGLLGGFAGAFSFRAGYYILTPVGWLLSFNESICRGVLSLPGAVFVAGKPGIAVVLLYYGILASVLYLLSEGAGRRWLFGIVAAIGIILFLREPQRFGIHVLDVGQGDGIFIQTGEGEQFFVDGGSSDVAQVGKYRILPFLKSKGVASVKGWVVSHADWDHISGLEELLELGYPIEYLIVAEGMAKDEASEHLLYLAKQAGCKVLYVSPGMEFGAGQAVFRVWCPEAGSAGEASQGRDFEGMETDGGKAGKTRDRNGASLVVSLEYQGFTGVFTGDIGVLEEQQLAREPEFCAWMERRGGSIDFYKAAHHGSNGSNSQALLETLSPKAAVISCGSRNSYGHPGKEALERLRQAGSRVFCTMEQGQMSLWPYKGKIRVRGFLP